MGHFRPPTADDATASGIPTPVIDKPAVYGPTYHPRRAGMSVPYIRKARIVRARNHLSQITNYKFHMRSYCTVNVTPCECTIVPSEAVSVTLKVPSPVGVWMFTAVVPVLLESACEVAVTTTVAGFGTVVGAV